MKKKPLTKFASLFHRSHSARSISANSVEATGTSILAPGVAGEASLTSVPTASADYASIQQLDTLLQVSKISGNAFVTTAEALRALDAILTTINASESDTPFSDLPTLDRLRIIAERFTNHTWPTNLTWLSPVTTAEMKEQQIKSNRKTTNLTCEEITSLLQLAAQAAHQVRIRPDIEQVVQIHGSDINSELDESEQGSITMETRLPRANLGLFKPTDVKFVVETVDDDDGGTLVIAIRGSKTWMDWLVNFDSGMVDGTALLGIEGIKAHAGLYAVARLMRKPTLDALKKHIGYPECLKKTGKKPRLLFTGHSAGGGVAAMIWQCAVNSKYFSHKNGEENFTTCFRSMHCFTFGAPPITEPSLSSPPKFSPTDEENLLIAVVNEGDPVPRADFDYTMSLLQLYTRGSADALGTGALLQLPPMTLKSAGPVVGLRVVEADGDLLLGDQIRMVELTPDIMQKTLAANPLAHSMDLYAANVDAVVKSDIPSLTNKKYLTKSLTFDALPVVNEEAAKIGPTFGGFREWWAAGDLDGHEQWKVSSVTNRSWTYVAYMFGIGPPQSGEVEGQPVVTEAVRHILDNIADREIV